jgi:hypothetical protein
VHVCDAKVQIFKSLRRDFLSVLDVNRNIIHLLGDRGNKANSENPTKAFFTALNRNRLVRLLNIGQFGAFADPKIVFEIKPFAVIVACNPAQDEQVLVL